MTANAAADGGEQRAEIPLRHYGFLAFLTLLNVMNFVDRQLLQSFANFASDSAGLAPRRLSMIATQDALSLVGSTLA